jgi:outer membrane biosynthesis protein TonB
VGIKLEELDKTLKPTPEGAAFEPGWCLYDEGRLLLAPLRIIPSNSNHCKKKKKKTNKKKKKKKKKKQKHKKKKTKKKHTKKQTKKQKKKPKTNR